MRYAVNGFARSYAILRHRRIVVERRSKRSLLQLLALGGFTTPQATISCLGLFTVICSLFLDMDNFTFKYIFKFFNRTLNYEILL